MRSFTATVAVLLATLVAPLAIGATWLTARVDDREAYVDVVAPLADDPVVRQVLAAAAADAAVAALQQYIPVGLPSAVRDWAGVAATNVVEGPEFPTFWRQANADLHDQVIALMDDPDRSPEGSITVDAGPLVAQVLLGLEDRGIPVGLLPEIPLVVPVETEAKVVEARPAYRAVDGVARLLPLIWGGLVAVAVLVAAGWRGRLRALGFALLGGAAAAGLLVVAAGPSGAALLDRVDVTNRELAGVMLDAVVDSVGPYARGFLLAAPLGLAALVASWWPRRRTESSNWPAQEPVSP